MNNHTWIIVVHDGFCAFKYEIKGADNVSARDIAKMVAKKLKGNLGQDELVKTLSPLTIKS